MALGESQVEKGTPARLPLSGLRVLDLSKVLAGPLCTQYLADLGAEVTKVEAFENGDETRRWPPLRGDAGAVFLSVNRNKRSIVINLKSEKGREIVHRLAKDADVAIESFSTGIADKLGCGASMLTALNPHLIYCSISGYGREGPLADAPGYDVILQAFTGIMALTGDEGPGYVRSPISPIDQGTGLHALIGILAALVSRQITGRGSIVEASLFDTAMGFLAYNLQSYWERGVAPRRWGSSHESLCPYQAFEASDGPIMIGVANDGLWRKFCDVANLLDIVDDPRFRSNPDRVANRMETIAVVQDAIGKMTVQYWSDELRAVGIPCSPINSLEQLLAHPHVQASGMILSSADDEGRPLYATAQPLRINGTRSVVRRNPPHLGQHTEEILSALGYDPAEISELQKSGVVR